MVGQTLDGRYVIQECIGEGGMGRVYRARHCRMSRSYAIKILFGDHAGDARMRSRFGREAEAVSRLSHANIIAILDFGETEAGLLYLVMDLAVGRPLRDVIAAEAPMTTPRATSILRQLCLGLSHAHDRGLIHRDFKGENVILVEENGIEVPKILDFGICMIVEDAPMSTMLTSEGIVMGTPAMMAPEQSIGDQVDHRSDLFSLGVVLYQMLAGQLPFDGTPLEIARKNVYERVPRVRDRTGFEVDPTLEAIALRLMEKRPENRFQSANEILEALGAAQWPTTPAPGMSYVDTGDSPSYREGMHLPSGDASSGRGATDAGHTVMLTDQTRRRSPTFWLLAMLGLIAVGALAAIVLTGRRDGSARATSSLAAAPTTPEETDSDTPAEVNSAPAETPQTGDVASADSGPPEQDPPVNGDENEASTEKADPETGSPAAAEPEQDEARPDRDKSARRGKRRGSRKRSGRRTRPKPKPPSTDEPDESNEPPSVAELNRAYEATNDAYEHYERRHGKDASKGFYRRLRSISYTRALSDPSLRKGVIERLRHLQRRIRRAQ